MDLGVTPLAIDIILCRRAIIAVMTDSIQCRQAVHQLRSGHAREIEPADDLARKRRDAGPSRRLQVCDPHADLDVLVAQRRELAIDPFELLDAGAVWCGHMGPSIEGHVATKIAMSNGM